MPAASALPWSPFRPVADVVVIGRCNLGVERGVAVNSRRMVLIVQLRLIALLTLEELVFQLVCQVIEKISVGHLWIAEEPRR